MAGGQRVSGIRRKFGLHAHDPGRGSQRSDGGGDPAGQPAATDRHQNRCDVRQLLHDLQSAGALPGDDPVVVEWRDHGQAALAREPLGDLLTLVARRPDHDDLRAILLDPSSLDRRGVGRHDDDCVDAEQASGARHPLRVIS